MKHKMKYKVGDKVKIRTWDDIKKEYGQDPDGALNGPAAACILTIQMEKDINEKHPNRILTIKRRSKDFFSRDCYVMGRTNTGWFWYDYMIEGLYEAYIEPVPILTRFEILDL